MFGMCKCRIQNQLFEWIDRECHLELLYKISVHGGTPEKFHELCDGKGPTVTVFYNTDKNVYGAYTSLSWRSDGSWQRDEQSFLFKLYTSKRWEPRKFSLLKTNTNENIFCDSTYGPLFENLRSFDGSVDKTSGYYSLSTDDLFNGGYYDMGGEDAQSVANGHNNVTDLEVYLVKDGLEKSMTVPWRDPPHWKSQAFIELKNYVIDYRPPEEMEVPEVNVSLVGQIGAGKSSLLNTMNSIFKGEMTSRTWTGSSENSLTTRVSDITLYSKVIFKITLIFLWFLIMYIILAPVLTSHMFHVISKGTKFNKFRIRDPSTRKFLNFRLCDTRGLEENMSMKNEDIAFVLDGHIPHNYTFNPVAQASNEAPGFQKQPSLKDKMHVVVFVVDGSTFDVMPEGILQKLKETKQMAIDRGVPLLVYITKIDKVCPLVDTDVTKVFYSKPVEELVDNVADVIAIPRSHILPVKNYEKESCLKTDINILALKALKTTLLFADDFLENQSEQQLLQEANRLNIKD